MLGKKDQIGLAKAYSLISEMHNMAGMSPQPGGIPVIVTMDMPGAEAEHSEHGHENDYSEIEMAASDLHKIAEYAPKLKEMIQNMSGLEGWVASKITKASDYISSVYHWLEYEQHEGDSSCGCGGEENSMHNAGYEDTHDCEYAAQGCKCGGCPNCH